MAEKKHGRSEQIAAPQCRNGEQIACEELANHVRSAIAKHGVPETSRRAQLARDVVVRIAARLPVRRASLALVAQNLNFRSREAA